MTPDPWQADVLRSDADRILLNCCRQSGKSTTTSGLAVHTALVNAGALVLLLSPSQRQSSELFRKCLDVYGASGRSVPSTAESALALELTNGSRIVSLPGREGTIRGFSSVDLLIIDEASRVEDATYYATRPMLAVSGGRLVALSTPFGKRGWWFEAWEQGGPGWKRVRVTAEQCPRISPAFLAEERATMPRMLFASEYLGEFTESEDSVFAYEDVERAVTPSVTPLFGSAA